MTTAEQQELYAIEVWYARHALLTARAEEFGILEPIRTAALAQAQAGATAAPLAAEPEAPPPPADPVLDYILRGPRGVNEDSR